MTTFTPEWPIPIRAAANEWISNNFDAERRHLTHTKPAFDGSCWRSELQISVGNQRASVGVLTIDTDGAVLFDGERHRVHSEISRLVRAENAQPEPAFDSISGDGYEFRLGDGLEGVDRLPSGSIDLLLTDPPYGISNPYTCESQVPRRLRKDGTDFIMPKGDFGHWDQGCVPAEWTARVIPKVAGWAVIFCAQAQIGEYTSLLKDHGMVAVGAMVWQKTNPVPFNHRFKPINAWEAIAVGKRPGTKFNGRVVHNVFVCKSPSPQERIHPTQKPLNLLSEFISLFSDEGDFVFDPFAGSGSTVIAAAEMKREALAYELDPGIYASAADRIQQRIGLFRWT